MYLRDITVQHRQSGGHGKGDRIVGEKAGKEGGSERISAPTTGGHPGRQANGQFLPGHTLPAAGRKPKAVEKAYLDAIRQALPPEHMEAVIAEALQLARDTRSWRGLLEVVQFAASYGAGKPTQKTVTTDGNLEQLLAALSSDVPLLPAADKQAEEQQGNKTII